MNHLSYTAVGGRSLHSAYPRPLFDLRATTTISHKREPGTVIPFCLEKSLQSGVSWLLSHYWQSNMSRSSPLQAYYPARLCWCSVPGRWRGGTRREGCTHHGRTVHLLITCTSIAIASLCPVVATLCRLIAIDFRYSRVMPVVAVLCPVMAVLTPRRWPY